MSSGQSAVIDDENEWYAFKKKVEITEQRWDVYSRQAEHAKDGFRLHKMTGKLLVQYVDAMTEVDRVVVKAREIKELREKLERAQAGL